ncbi:MAG: hypothetical protein ACRD1R_09965 [Acidobacteriota bacterium]
MAFLIDQRFDDVQHEYDRDADVLYISFGPPRPSVTLAVEDWLALRISPSTAEICGITIIGFKHIFSNIRRDLLEELPSRVDRLKSAHFRAQYLDETDTLTFRFEQEQPAYYDRFDENIYLERSLTGQGIIGFKITRYTEQGESAMERLLAAIIDALFTPPDAERGPADALTRAFIEHLNIPKLLSLAA